ncbi:MAG: hypothetical protein GTO17_12285 [Candidatus Aminicenantes bacterium]|nr:hypothetical protein [Candidatus Aminicenantes bacterium]
MTKFYFLLITISILLSPLLQTSTSDSHRKAALEDKSVFPYVSVALKEDIAVKEKAHVMDSGLIVEKPSTSSEMIQVLPTAKNLGTALSLAVRTRMDKDKNMQGGNHEVWYRAYSNSSEKTGKVAAGERYRARGLYQIILGTDYRKLWVKPLKLGFLDLKTEAGGIVPVMRVGGHQTKGLAFRGADGRSYTFRGVDKDPTAVLPPYLEGTIADRLVQDQISSSHPAAPVVVGPIIEAAGVLHTKARLVIMPDDPALGEFRAEFAGLLGTFHEYPTPVSDTSPGFMGATEILNYIEMWERLEASPSDRVDSLAFLRARLVDLFIGDWDRHRKQWRWAKIPGKPFWQPLPEDRDQAFCRYDGLFLSIVRYTFPYILNFGEKYSGIEGMTFGGWDLDRYLLTELEKSDWQTVATNLKTRLTDSVIEKAIQLLPPEYYVLDSARLESDLKKRRDRLLEVADRYYHHLAREVDIHMTDKEELAEVVQIDNNTAEVRISLRPADGDHLAPKPYYQRRFHRHETREIRLYLRGGDDKVITRGTLDSGIIFRIIGGPGQDTVDDSKGGSLRISDSTGKLKMIPGPGTILDKRKYVPPPPNPRAPWAPPRDWGQRTIPVLWFGGGPDVGAFLGAGFSAKIYGFRKHPFSSYHTVRAGYTTIPKKFRVDYQGEFHLENSRSFFNVSARASGFEILRFYGFGNETSNEEPDDFYKVEQEQYSLHFSLMMALVDSLYFSVGPTLKYSITNLEDDRFIHAARPYGIEDFSQLGIRTGLHFDKKNHPIAATRGIRISLEGRYFPKFWSVKSAFGDVRGYASAFLTASSIPLEPTLAFRIGGKKIFGTYPFQEAAFIGGGGLTGTGSTVRGFRAQRFAGDSSLYGNLELRFRLSNLYLFLPGEIGLFGLADVGRVFLDGENSNAWHSAIGGGIWVTFLERRYTFSIAVAKSDERTSLYVRSGFSF